MQKILFVCRANVGRSQIAEALFNKLSPKNRADSAGTSVDTDNQTIGQRALDVPAAGFVIDVLKEDEGIDISSKRRTQLRPEMLDNYSKVITLISEPEFIPNWLSAHSKYEQWQIDDPHKEAKNGLRKTKDEIKSKVQELVASLSR